MPERIDLELESSKVDLKFLEEETKLRLRKQFAYIMVTLVGLTNLATLVLLFFIGFGFRSFHLSDAVIIAIIGGTVAELAGLFIVIIKFLFDDKVNLAEGKPKRKPS